MDNEVVSNRNNHMMSNHMLNIKRSAGPYGTCNGLCTAETLAAKAVLPVKGIWFEILNDLEN